jgi:hypothetical protein
MIQRCEITDALSIIGIQQVALQRRT